MPAAPMSPAGIPLPGSMAPPSTPSIHDIMPGIKAEVQDNGMTVLTLPPLTPGGKPQVVSVMPAPKIPKALQPAQPAAR